MLKALGAQIISKLTTKRRQEDLSGGACGDCKKLVPFFTPQKIEYQRLKKKNKKLNLMEVQREELQGMPWNGAVQFSATPRAASAAAAVNSKCTFHLQENGTLAKI